MKSIRDALLDHTDRIWSEMREASAMNLFLNEETITEMLLLRLAQDFRTVGLRAQPFTKPKEKRRGADWQWIVAGKSTLLRLRIQAKRLYPNGQYKALKPKGMQTDRLISCGGRYPFFVFYNTASFLPRKALRMLQPCTCGAAPTAPFGWGAAIAYAPDVRSVGKQSFEKLASKMRPLHCIFCVSAGNGKPLPEQVSGSLRERISTDLEGVEEITDEMRGMLDWIETRGTEAVSQQWSDRQRRAEEYLDQHQLAGIFVIRRDDALAD